MLFAELHARLYQEAKGILTGRHIDMDVVTSVLAAAAIASLAINARQLSLQTTALRLQTASMEEDRAERASQRQLQRTTLFTALKAELQEIRTTAQADYDEYRGDHPQSDRVRQEGDSRANEGERRHRIGFPWSQLPDNIVAQAISEAALLGLKPGQIEQLLTLRGRIQRVDTLVRYKVGLYPALMQADVPKDWTMTTGPWVEGRAAHLNNALEAAVYSIIASCNAILDKWRFEETSSAKDMLLDGTFVKATALSGSRGRRGA